MPEPRFEVRLTRGAEADLEALHAYLAEHASAKEADRLLDRIVEAIGSLERFPARGPVPKELATLGLREFRQMLIAPWRLIYRIDGETVTVMLIADGRRDMQSLLERRLLGG